MLNFIYIKAAVVVKNTLENEGDIRDAGSIPGLGRSPGERHGNHSSILAWKIPWTEASGGCAAVCGVTKSHTRLKQHSTHTFLPPHGMAD